MNKKLKNEIAKVFEFPVPSNKSQFLRSLPRQRISTKAFVLRQISFIKTSVWLLSLLILLPAIGGAWFVGEDMIWIVSSFIPFLALLLITESTKSKIYGMNELEMSSRFSLKSVMLAKLSILGILDFFIFAILIVVCYLVSGTSLLQTGVYLFVPYLLTTNISLYLVRHSQSKEAVSWCMAVAVLVSGTNIALRYLADFLYQTNYLVWWVIATLLLLGSIIRELYQTFRKTEGFIWNFALTD